MNIINSDIISAEQDVFWQETSAITKGMSPRPVLVITTRMEEGGAEKMQLQKMLVVSELAPEQYNIVELDSDRKVAWHHLRDALQPKFVFLIGIPPSSLGVSAMFLANEPNRFNDIIWLPTFSISELEQRQDVKKHLWVSGMKPIFVDKVYGEIALSILP